MILKRFEEKGLSRPYIIFLQFLRESVSCKAAFCRILDLYDPRSLLWTASIEIEELPALKPSPGLQQAGFPTLWAKPGALAWGMRGIANPRPHCFARGTATLARQLAGATVITAL